MRVVPGSQEFFRSRVQAAKHRPSGLKTTDVLTGEYEAEAPIAPKLAEF